MQILSPLNGLELAMTGHTLPLTVAHVGVDVRIHAVRAQNCQKQRLRELGILEGRTLRVVCTGDPLICQIGDGRFGLCRRLARCVYVEPDPIPVARSA